MTPLTALLVSIVDIYVYIAKQAKLLLLWPVANVYLDTFHFGRHELHEQR